MVKAGRLCIMFASATLVACAGSVICRGQTTRTWQPPATLDALPAAAELPDLLRLSNDQPVHTPEQWKTRREELKAMLQYYEYGHLPPRPDQVSAEDVVTKVDLDSGIVQQRLVLVIGSQQQLKMQCAISRPRQDQRYPVVITEVHSITPLPCIPLFVKNGYLFVQYQREDLAPDQADAASTAQDAYPKYDWATLAVWAWGAMRVVDYLESRSDVDLQHIAITGHSRGGKAALLAGAMDERFALVCAQRVGLRWWWLFSQHAR